MDKIVLQLYVRANTRTLSKLTADPAQKNGRAALCDTPENHIPEIQARRSAISTTFCSSIARVIGPTPPGFGVYAETFS